MSKLRTKVAHAGCQPGQDHGAVSPPVHFSTTFERDADGSYSGEHIYSRTGNPTRDRFEATMCDLEGGTVGMAFSSGMAAADAVFRTLRPGDHVVIPDDVYYGVRHLLGEVYEPWGLRVSSVDMSDPDRLAAAMTPDTRLIWLETPSNPLLRITDIRAAAQHRGNALLVVDSTWTTPLLQQPLRLGADVVVHSVTKYLAGHSDVLGGAVIFADSGHPAAERVRTIQTGGGAVMDPMSAWLTMRGIRSLAARLAFQCDSAERIASYLVSHPAIEAVHYPGLPADPGHETARKQMHRFGGMLSVRIRGGHDAALGVAGRAAIFRRATSLGGTESLIEHRASVEAQPSSTPDNLLRLSVGLEDPDDLIDDLSRALAGASGT